MQINELLTLTAAILLSRKAQTLRRDISRSDMHDAIYDAWDLWKEVLEMESKLP